jgi:GT2 family glycosyltransferase
MTDQKIAVVTVNWNRPDLTLRCLEALQRTVGAQWRLYIVDNASTDDSVQRLENLGEIVTLIQAKSNGGWTGGNNLGVRRALADGYRNVLLLNNDAFVEPATLANLLAAKGGKEGEAILGPIHLDGAGEAFDFVGTDDNPETGLYVAKSVQSEAVAALPEIIPTSSIKGAGILADALHFERVGLFDERFYLNFDETDWCYRARKLGFPLAMVKAARIHHLGSATIGGFLSPLQSYFMTRNVLLFSERHCTLRQRSRLIRWIYWDARRDLPGLQPERRGWLWRAWRSKDLLSSAWRRGIVDYVFRRFGDCPAMIRKWNNEYRA